MTFDTDSIARSFADRGLRLTRQRRAVVDAVSESVSCLNALQVLDAARVHCPELGLTTVYRTLEVLGEIGAVRRLHGPDHCEGFVSAGAAHGHTVVCSRCGRAAEFTECDIQEVVDAAARQTGFRITEHFLQLSGVCAACRAEDGAVDDGAPGGHSR